MYTVIIPSGSIENLAECVAALHEERIIAIMHEPFCFARACNAGIRAAGDDDVVLLGDDGILLTPDGFRAMGRLAEARPEFGIISASVTGDVYCPEQAARASRLFWEAHEPMVAFICVYIPRATISSIGLPDERFSGYGYEDDDYCRRVRDAGLRIAVCGDCVVDHRGARSVYRSGKKYAEDKYEEMRERNRTLLEQKWGTHP
jgi:GT2 family glycosyltransferase